MCDNITKKLMLSQYDKLSIFEKKFLLNKKRLRLNNIEIKNLISILIEHFEQKIYFKLLYKKYKSSFLCNYQNFMKKIAIITPLFEFLFNRISRKIIENTTVQIIDSSLISCLKRNSLRFKHKEKGVVTVRKDQQKKLLIRYILQVLNFLLF